MTLTIVIAAVNAVTLFMAWFYWMGGDVFGLPNFIAWAGKNPLLHRLFFSGELAVFGAMVWWAYRKIPSSERDRIWVFRVWSALTKKRIGWFVAGLVLFSVWLLGRVNAARYDAFCSGFDLAVFDQAIWNTLKGRFLWSSIKGNICLLGDHMSPILLFYVPWMALWEDARVLLWVQAAIMGLNGWLVYQLCRQRWEQSELNWIFPLAYFIYLPARNACHFEFHPEMLADTFIFLSFWFLNRGNRWGFIGSLSALVLCKETFWGLLFLVGLYLCVFGRHVAVKLRVRTDAADPAHRSRWPWITGGTLLLVSPLAFWLEIHCLIPWISGQPYPYVGNYNRGFAALASQAASLSSVAYLIKVFAPLGFLSFLSPSTVFLTAFGLAQNLFSVNPATHSIFFQYTVGLTPFVFLSAIEGANALELSTARVLSWLRKYAGQTRIAVWLIVWSVLFSGVSENYLYRYYRAQQTPALERAKSYLQCTPESTIVKTNEFFAAHLAHRPYLYLPDHGGFQPYERDAQRNEEKLVLMGRNFGQGISGQTIQFLRDHGYQMVLNDGDICVMEAGVETGRGRDGRGPAQ